MEDTTETAATPSFTSVPAAAPNSRRKFLQMFGVSSAGVALAGAVAASKAKIKEGGEDAKAEIEKLQKAYEELDKRSKLILRLVLVISGLDIFLAQQAAPLNRRMRLLSSCEFLHRMTGSLLLRGFKARQLNSPSACPMPNYDQLQS